MRRKTANRMAIEIGFIDYPHSRVRVVKEATWPYTARSLERIERQTGIAPDVAREALDAGNLIVAEQMQFRLVPADPEKVTSLSGQPSPPTLQTRPGPTGTELYAPCECGLCVYIITRGYLAPNQMDCGWYPDQPGNGTCSDLHEIGCTCLGTSKPGGPCEACEAYIGNPQAVAIISEGRRRTLEAARERTRADGAGGEAH